MNEQTDSQLLQAYAEHRSEAAFSELVRRHIDFVHSAAQRMVGDSHLAQDVTQGAFLALAKKAGELGNLSVLSAWLHRTTRNIAAQTVRTEVRRRAREKEAALMNESQSAETGASWDDIAPQLDAGIGELNDSDREALLLRYFERKSAREMAQRIGTSEEAAQKRVNRAVERLRDYFAKRGVTVSASGLTVLMAAHGVQAAPVELATAVSSVSSLPGSTLITTATAIKAIVMTTFQKTLLTAALVVAVIVAVVMIRRPESSTSATDNSRPQSDLATGSASRTNSPFWRRFDASRRAANTAASVDPELRYALARLKLALYGPATSGGRPEDEAYKILTAIPLKQRAAALEMVTQALRSTEQHVCRRAISLIPLIWPEGEAALPTLFDLVRTKSSEWPGLAGEALMAATQVRSEKDVIPELVLAAMQGGSRSQSELALQFPLLKGQIKESGDAFAASLLPFLYSTDQDERLTAAKTLAQIPGLKDPLVVTELAASLTNTATQTATYKIRSSLSVLSQMGADAHDAIPALLALAKSNPELHDSAWAVLKAIEPNVLQGMAVPTPLPPHQGSSQAISAQLQAGTWTIQDAINALKSPDMVLPTARALADFGSNASAALPAMREALAALSATNLNAAIVISTAIERLDPNQPKPLLLTWDVLPALDAVRTEAARIYTEAQSSGLSNWDQSLASLHERIPFGLAFTHSDVRALATELGRIDLRLQQAFQAKLLQSDPKFAVIFQAQGNR